MEDGEFEANLSYLVRHCLKTKKQTNKKSNCTILHPHHWTGFGSFLSFQVDS
jgi:hypothetical protein